MPKPTNVTDHWHFFVHDEDVMEEPKATERQLELERERFDLCGIQGADEGEFVIWDVKNDITVTGYRYLEDARVATRALVAHRRLSLGLPQGGVVHGLAAWNEGV